MTKTLAVAIALAMALAQPSSVRAQLQAAGMISGTITGPSGILAGATVQILDAAQSIVATASTTQAGVFSVAGLNPGVFAVHVIGSNGALIGVSTATLIEGAMAVALEIGVNAGVLAATATAAVTAAATGTATGVSATTVLAGLGAAAASLGTAAVISTGADPSGSN